MRRIGVSALEVYRIHAGYSGRRNLAVVATVIGLGSIAQAQPAAPTAVVLTSSKLLAIDPAIAINNEGYIAFTGQDAAGSKLFVYLGLHQDPKPLTSTNTGISYAGVGLSGG